MRSKSFKALLIVSLVTTLVAVFAFSKKEENQDITSLTWMSIDSALAVQNSAPKMILIDLYTDWCGWCKQMDDKTFGDANVSAAINKQFYPVKFNAEIQTPIVYKGTTFNYTLTNNRGLHGLAKELGAVNGRMGYPTIIILDEKGNKLGAYPGYKDAEQMLKLCSYYSTGAYKLKSWNEYLSK